MFVRRILTSFLLLMILVSCQKERSSTTDNQLASITSTPLVGVVPSPAPTVLLGIEVEFVVLEQNDWGEGVANMDSPTPKLAVISSKDEILNTSTLVSPEAKNTLELIDYDSQLALVIWQGRKPTSKYGVEVQRIIQIDDEIRILTQFNEPEIGTEISDIETFPYQIVQIRKPDPNLIHQYLLIDHEKVVFIYPDPGVTPIPTSGK